MLFSGAVAQIEQFLSRMERRGLLHTLRPVALDDWLRPEPQVVLREESALELGSTASLSLIVWETGPGANEPDEILLVGPDLDRLSGPALPFAQVVQVGVVLDNDDPYLYFQQLRQVIYRLGLRDTMVRVLPGRQHVWWRFHRRAQADGLDASVLGSAICAAVRRLPFVRRVRVILVTAGADVVRTLEPTATMVLDITLALVQMHERSMDVDCGDCRYEAVCDAVEELRQLHRRLAKKEAG